jgi:hypothetical protein
LISRESPWLKLGQRQANLARKRAQSGLWPKVARQHLYWDHAHRFARRAKRDPHQATKVIGAGPAQICLTHKPASARDCDFDMRDPICGQICGRHCARHCIRTCGLQPGAIAPNPGEARTFAAKA